MAANQRGGAGLGQITVYQALMTQRNTYQAQADSYREQEITLQTQLNAAQSSVTRLRKLGPTYASFLREKTSLEERLKGYNTKEGEALVNRALDETNAENIKNHHYTDHAAKRSQHEKDHVRSGILGVNFFYYDVGAVAGFP